MSEIHDLTTVAPTVDNERDRRVAEWRSAMTPDSYTPYPWVNDETQGDRPDAEPECGSDFEHSWNLDHKDGPYCTTCETEMSWDEWHGRDEYDPDPFEG